MLDLTVIKGLHCGSGQNLLAGWLNTDALTLTDADGRPTVFGRTVLCAEQKWYLQHDATRPFPIRNNSFSCIFSEHFVEHISPAAGISWLHEMRRLLRPGGVLRVSTPDLRKYVAGYVDPNNGFFAEHARRLQAMGNSPQLRPAWLVNQIFRFWGHQWVYDVSELRFAAEQAGFRASDVQECGFRRGRIAEMACLDLPMRNDESLYIEIVKSS